MDPNKIVLLYRFGQKDHLEQLLDGKLRFTPINTYRDLPEDQTRRGDVDEALTEMHQPTEGKDWIHLIPHSGPMAGTGITLKMTGPMKVLADASNASVLCFSKAIKAEATEVDPGKTFQLLFHPGMFSLGDHVLVTQHPHEFIRRFNSKALEAGIVSGSGSVEYINRVSFDGEIKKIGFTKFADQYSHQKEYRLMLAFKEIAEPGYILNVGSLTDIAEIRPLRNG